jgi:lysophospholipase L1-like esterase
MVTDGKAYPQYLQDYLQTQVADASLRVINGGVNAYSTREELLFLKQEGLGFQPDIVIVGFVPNDASLFARQYQLAKFRDILTRSGRHNLRGTTYTWLQRSHFVRFVSRFLKGMFGKAGSGHEFRTQINRLNRDMILLDSEEAVKGLEITMSELDEIVEILDRRDIGLLLVIFPNALQLEALPAPTKLQEMMREFCKSRGVSCLDLLPFLSERRGEHLFVDITHLTPEGNRMVAELIGDYLIENGFL